MAFSYTLVTHDRTAGERTRSYTSEDPLAPGSVLLLGGRYWLVEQVNDSTVEARPARYRLTLRHPDGREEAGAFRRYRGGRAHSGAPACDARERRTDQLGGRRTAPCP